MQAAALRARGWSISAIARHLGRDRKTVRGYLSGKRAPGQRKRTEPDPFDAIAGYVARRLADDAHVWATALYDEVVALGYPLSYQSFTRSLRQRHLRPHCEACAGVKGRDTIEIPHPAGAECQWDWDELPEAPWGGDAHLLLGTLPYSGQFRGYSPRPRTRAMSSRASTPSCGRSAGRPGPGALTAWPPSWTPAAAGYGPVLPRWPSIIRRWWLSARPGGATARARSKSPSILPPSVFGAP